MTTVKRSWDSLDDKQRKEAIDTIISFFRNERGEEIGILAAENVLDMFLQDIGTKIYNKAIDDVKYFLKNRNEEIQVDIDVNLRK